MVSKSRLVILLLLVLMANGLASGDTYWVRHGWQTFTHPADARFLALGGSPVAASGNLAQTANPALTGSAEEKRITYSHQSRFAGIVNSDLLAFDLPLNYRNPVGLVLMQESVDRIPNTNGILLDWGLDGIPNSGDFGEGNGVLDEGERLDDERLDYFKQRQLALHLSTRWVWGRNQVGVALKGLYHSLGDNHGTGIGFDLGVARKFGRNLQAGISVYDALTSWVVWDSGTVERTAPSIKLGLGSAFEAKKLFLDISFYGDAIIRGYELTDSDISIGSNSIVLSCGIELIFKDKFQLRLGQDEVGLATAGVGMHWDNIGIDYASRMEPKGSGLGPSHYFSFTISPSWLKRIGDSL